jgi:hypothetical protein
MPAALVIAAALFVLLGVFALVLRIAVSVVRADPYWGAGLGPENAVVAWLTWLVPLAVIGLGIMLRGGGNGVRITLTVVGVLLAVAGIGSVLDSVLMLMLVAAAVVGVGLLWRPESSAYIREAGRR